MNTFVNWRIKMRRTLKKGDLINFSTSDTYREISNHTIKEKKGIKLNAKQFFFQKNWIINYLVNI